MHWEASGASRVQWQRPRSPLWHSKANWEGLGGLWEVIEGTRRPWEALECTGKIGSLQVALEHEGALGFLSDTLESTGESSKTFRWH